jgi:PAS domain S-box-containing protein
MSLQFTMRTYAPAPVSGFADAAFERLGSAALACDTQGRLVLANARARELLRINERRVTLRPAHWCDRCAFRRPGESTLLRPDELPLAGALQGRATGPVRLEIRCDRGRWRTLDVTAEPLLDAEGQPSGAVLTMHDLTQAALAEAALQPPAAAAQNLAAGVALVRAADGVFTYVNPEWERMFGYQPGELPGRHISVINAPSDEDPVDGAGRTIGVLASGAVWSGALENQRRDGSRLWTSAVAVAFDDARMGRLIAIVQVEDSDLRAAGDTLRDLQALVDAAPVGLAVLDEDLRVAFANAKLREFTRRPEPEPVSRQLAELVNPDDRAQAMELVRATQAAPGTAGSARVRLAGGGAVVLGAARTADGSAQDLLVISVTGDAGRADAA